MTTPFTDAEARRIAASFTLADAPDDFIDDPYRYYAALRRHAPVHAIGAGQWLLTRYDDVSQLYREPSASSDKQREFAPSSAPARRSSSTTRTASSSTTRRCTRACAG